MGFFSTNISFKEGTLSNTATDRGIDNIPNLAEIDAMRYVSENIFQKVREHFNKPMRINSFFRSAALNVAIGGSSKSQHCKGEAIDVSGLNGLTNKEIFDYIKDHLDFDQLIWEFGTDEEPKWVHFSLKKEDNRKQCLQAYKLEGKTKYQVL